MTTTERTRLDEALVARGLAPSRSRARDMILRGSVRVEGAVAEKPGHRVSPAQSLAVDDPAARYVSRSALKLLAGLDAFGLDPKGLTVLDLGASTGGFTQVLLERGAASVLAVDVGQGQLDPALDADRRVRRFDSLNARDLTPEAIGQAEPHAIVCDVSFISLKLALPSALALARPQGWGVFLVKPQFEVGREHVGKGGIVRDEAAARAAADEIARWIEAEHGWCVLGVLRSPIAGGDGNREYLLGARRG